MKYLSGTPSEFNIKAVNDLSDDVKVAFKAINSALSYYLYEGK